MGASIAACGSTIAVVRRWAYTHMDEITASRDNYDQQPAANVTG